jgi:phosphohistidine phosphatase SixA
MATIYLVRHAHAGKRSEWDADDELRPLSPKGECQAEGIATYLADAGIDLLWTSPYIRCRQTLEPLAERIGLGIVDSEPLREGGAGPVALDALLAAVADGRTLAVCSHGDVLPAVADAAVRRGADLVGMRALAKGAWWEATVYNGQIDRLVHVAAPPCPV